MATVTQGMRLIITTVNRTGVEPFRHHFRNGSSTRTDSAVPLRAVVFPVYQICPFSSGQCVNNPPLPVPDWKVIVHLWGLVRCLTANWYVTLKSMTYDIPESKRAMIREGVPTPIPILEQLASPLWCRRGIEMKYLVLFT